MPSKLVSWRPTLACIALALATTAAQAQMFKDKALDALYATEHWVELDRSATQRASADDPQGVLALAIASLRGNDATRRKAALTQAEACLQKQPRSAPCHYALGTVLGVQAMSEGLLKMAGSVGRVRESLAEALAIEPTWYAARSALVEFYLLAPGMIGGSTSKARELAAAASQPEQVRALQARVALQDGKFEQALQGLSDIKQEGDSALVADANGWARAAAFNLINDGKSDKARPYFERLARERPDQALGPYALGRMQAEAGVHDQALKLYEQGARLKGAEEFPFDYRAGLSQLALGQKDVARASLERFVKVGKGSKANLEDARKRLADLGS